MDTRKPKLPPMHPMHPWYQLPTAITRFIADASLTADDIGESPCSVYRFSKGGENFFLKTSPPVLAPTTYSVKREAQALQWLSGRIGVPELMAVVDNEYGEAMITRAVPGKPLSARIEAGQPVSHIFLEALRQLQGIPIKDCPLHAGAAIRLKELEYLVSKGLHDQEYVLDQWPGLHDEQDLLRQLHATMPEEDLVFAHGDLGDSNLFVDANDQLYFIDLGRAGIADRWMDIAFAHRNLREDVSGKVADEFLKSLPFVDEPAKREFFMQLDELF
ncbi:MAG: APH(3') family aminoglycoside O-phosphotransferase [Undibacterium umbellatum]|uniref:APH(3') family aminoglycoside O-phosphotransferase n=1 Tax=Undibacterium umbellatum TaxID=2762300 RepID=UPI003BB4E1DE